MIGRRATADAGPVARTRTAVQEVRLAAALAPGAVVAAALALLVAGIAVGLILSLLAAER